LKGVECRVQGVGLGGKRRTRLSLGAAPCITTGPVAFVGFRSWELGVQWVRASPARCVPRHAYKLQYKYVYYNVYEL